MSSGGPMLNPSGRVYIAAAIITAGGVIVAAIIAGIIGRNAGQQQAFATAVQQQASAVAAAPTPDPVTQVAVTQVSITQIVVTEVAITQIVVTEIVATSPPVVVTATLPPPTPIPENPPLNVGESLKQEDVSLTLRRVVPRPNGVFLYWDLKNDTGKTISLDFSLTNFNAEDIMSKEQLKVVGYVADNGSGGCEVTGVSGFLEAGKSLYWPCNYPLFIEADLVSTKVREIIVTVSDISRIKRVQWKIPVDLR